MHDVRIFFYPCHAKEEKETAAHGQSKKAKESSNSFSIPPLPPATTTLGYNRLPRFSFLTFFSALRYCLRCPFPPLLSDFYALTLYTHSCDLPLIFLSGVGPWRNRGGWGFFMRGSTTDRQRDETGDIWTRRRRGRLGLWRGMCGRKKYKKKNLVDMGGSGRDVQGQGTGRAVVNWIWAH